jgi:hypothetical protein
MSGFVEQLMLAERAAENIYFAKVNRELIESLHKRMQADKNFLSTCRQNVEAQAVNSPPVLKGTGGS